MKKYNFIYNNVYSYDIPSCHYNILKNSGYDVSEINEHDKKERNTQIGLLMKDDKNLTKFLRDTTKQIIDFYIENNFINKNEIILRQYDGFYTTRYLNLHLKHNLPAKLELKNLYDVFIFSINRKMYLGVDYNKDSYLIKGIPFKYHEIENLYKKILRSNFLNIRSIFNKLQKLKLYILNSDKIQLYAIPVDDDKTEFKIFFKEIGELIISKQSLKLIDPSEIDKYKYFQIYLEPFFKSIVYHTL